jgi:polyvinyl alcohol dehydrogenase (cytochrome)
MRPTTKVRRHVVRLASATLLLAGAAACGAAPTTAASAERWTSIGNGTDAHGAAPPLAPSTASRLHQCWERDTGAVFGSPVIAQGTVYVHSIDGLWALDQTTGSVEWHVPEIAGYSSPTLAGDTIVTLDTGGSTLSAVDRRTGHVAWRTPLATSPESDAFSSPIVADGIVVVGQASSEAVTSGGDHYSFRGSIAAVDLRTGELMWRHFTAPPGSSGAGVWTAPSIDPATRTVFAGTGQNYSLPTSGGSNSVVALDLDTGATRWMRQLLPGDAWAVAHPALGWDFDVSTSPVLVDGRGENEPSLVVVGQKSGLMTALDRDDGTIVWQVRVAPGSLQGGIMGNLSVFDDVLLTVGNNAASAAPGAEAAAPGAPLDLIAGMGNSGELVPTSVLTAVDVRTGKQLWERQLSTWVFAPLTIAGEVAFVPVGPRVEIVATATGELLSELALPKATSGGAAVVDDTVFIGVSGTWDFDGSTFHAFGAACH